MRIGHANIAGRVELHAAARPKIKDWSRHSDKRPSGFGSPSYSGYQHVSINCFFVLTMYALSMLSDTLQSDAEGKTEGTDASVRHRTIHE